MSEENLYSMGARIGSELAAALAAFQAECRDVAPNAEADTGKFTYRYADLSTVLGEIRPKLEKHGLAILQIPTDGATVGGGTGVGVRTMIVHSSGESLDAGMILLPNVQGTPQGAGACITYARRYALGALAGIATDHDDDAAIHQPNGASETPRRAASSGARSAAAQPGDEAWMNAPVPGKKHKGKTYRDMLGGSVGGQRHQDLQWLRDWIQGNLDEEPTGRWAAKNRGDLAKLDKCLAIYSNRADQDAHDPDLPL